MPIPADGYPLAAAVSPRVQVVETTDSTNADVVAAVIADDAGWPHLSVLVTTDQRRGRGRLDRTWVTPAGTALAASVVVRVGALPVHARGWIPLIAGVAMTRAIAAQLRGIPQAVGLKWPNDVLVEGQKICGILAEAVPGEFDAVVVGAGVNTRMPRVDLPVATAVSFAALGQEADEDKLLADYLSVLDELLAALIAADGDAVAAGVQSAVESACTTLGADVAVSLPDGTTLEGRAERIDAEGRLVVSVGGAEVPVAAGDVTHVR